MVFDWYYGTVVLNNLRYYRTYWPVHKTPTPVHTVVLPVEYRTGSTVHTGSRVQYQYVQDGHARLYHMYVSRAAT